MVHKIFIGLAAFYIVLMVWNTIDDYKTVLVSTVGYRFLVVLLAFIIIGLCVEILYINNLKP